MGRRFDALFGWMQYTKSPQTPNDLAWQLSCEAIRHEEIPPSLRSALTTFRHLTREARSSACESFWKRKVFRDEKYNPYTALRLAREALNRRGVQCLATPQDQIVKGEVSRKKLESCTCNGCVTRRALDAIQDVLGR